MQKKFHSFKTKNSGSARKSRRGGTKMVRKGARFPGGSGHGTVRHPF